MHQRFRILPARPQELDRILEIEHACFGRDAYDRNLFAGFFHKCGDLFLTVKEARDICGYMVTCIRGKGPAARAELVSVAVDPKAQKRGAATALMKSTIRRLKLRKVGTISLMVRVSNMAAQAFYEKFGFAKGKRVKRYYEDAEDGWYMKRSLEKAKRKRAANERE